MYEHAGHDETGVKLREANWLSGVIEQHPAVKWGSADNIHVSM